MRWAQDERLRKDGSPEMHLPPKGLQKNADQPQTCSCGAGGAASLRKSFEKDPIKIDFIFHSGRTWGLGSPPRTASSPAAWGSGWEERSVYSASGHLAGFCIPGEAVSWYRIDYSNQGTSVL